MVALNIIESGEYPWQPLASQFSNGAWYMFFRENGGIGRLAINGTTGTYMVLFANNEIQMTGVEPACTFNFTRQDANGAAGSFDCRLPGSKSDGTVVMVDFKGDFDGHI
ncbi:MAG: hypothetical protein ABJC24_09985 [Chloroflexota bacterium]